MTMKNDALSHKTLNSEEAELLGMLIPQNAQNRFDNLVGHVACAQYVIQKHQFIEQSKRDEDEEPSEDKIRSLISSFRAENSNALATLRTSSEQLIKNFAEEYSKMKNSKEFLQPLKSHIDIRTRRRNSIFASIVGAFIYSLIVAAIVFIVTVAKPESKFSKAFKIIFIEEVHTQGKEEISH